MKNNGITALLVVKNMPSGAEYNFYIDISLNVEYTKGCPNYLLDSPSNIICLIKTIRQNDIRMF